MFGSSLSDLALRRVWIHRTHRSRMSSRSLRSMRMSSTSLRSTPSYGLASLASSSSSGACRSRPDRLPERVFRVCGRSLIRSSARQPYEPSEGFYQPSSQPFEACCCEVLCVGISSSPLSVAMTRSSQPLHTRTRAPTLCSARALRARGQFERCGKHGVGHVDGDVTPSRISSSAATFVFATWHRRFASTINRLRSAVFGTSLVLSLFLRFGADLRGMRAFAYTRL